MVIAMPASKPASASVVQVRRHPVERLADREVGAAVTHVVHREDERALQPEDSGDADEEPDHGAQPAERAEQEQCSSEMRT